MILKKENLNKWLEDLKHNQLFAPVETNGIIQFEKVKDINKIGLNLNSLIPPKRIIFPQTESLFEFKKGKKIDIKTPLKNDEKLIIFGIKPCDAKSFLILDKMFYSDITDKLYQRKREKTIFIGISCNKPSINCFCTSFDLKPYSREAMDILLTDLGDRYYVDAITEIGKKLINESISLFFPATDDDIKEVKKTHKNSIQYIKRKVDISGIPDKLAKIYDSDYWNKISMKCLGCGICTYLCPTCYCFDMQDETQNSDGRRIRTWDSCMYSEYTLHTSGHNPRESRMNRLRNRIYHKFKYHHENFGNFLCTGCGRCIDKCPVNVDLIEIISKIVEDNNE